MEPTEDGIGSATLNDEGSTEPERVHRSNNTHNQTGKIFMNYNQNYNLRGHYVKVLLDLTN